MGGIFFTFGGIALSMGQLLGETQAWNKAQDERFVEHQRVTDNDRALLLDLVRGTAAQVIENGTEAAALGARLHSIEERLARNEVHIYSDIN